MTLIALFMFGACSSDDVLLKSEALDAQVSETRPDAEATDAGCAACVPYDASAVRPADAGRDANRPDANSCTRTDRPACSRVACTWVDAQQKIPKCLTAPVTLTPHYAARCGDFDALAYQGTDSIDYHIYDAAGRMVAIRTIGLGASCTVFDDAFAVPERCKMVTPKCPPEEDGGS